MAGYRRVRSNGGAKRGQAKIVVEKPQKRSNRRQNQKRSDVDGGVHVKPVTQYTSSDEEDDNQEGGLDDEGQNLKPRQLPYDSGDVSSLGSESDDEEEDEENVDDVEDAANRRCRTKPIISPNAVAGVTATNNSAINGEGVFSGCGFRSPTSKNAVVKAYRALLRRYEETKEDNVELRRQISNHEEEIKKLQRREVVASVRKRAPLKTLAPELQEHVRVMSDIFRREIVRSLKFAESGWDLYSEVRGTLCEKIMSSLDLPVGYSSELRMSLWCNVLAPQMSKTLSSAKNKITQSMREQFNCKFYEVSCDIVNILIILIVYIVSL